MMLSCMAVLDNEITEDKWDAKADWSFSFLLTMAILDADTLYYT